MQISSKIKELRTRAGMSQDRFAEAFGVSRQAVQKWESGESLPELEKLAKISKYFAISLDELVLANSARTVEALYYNKRIKPNYAGMDEWDTYEGGIRYEYDQCVQEGLDVAKYAELFKAVTNLERGEYKKKLCDVLFEIVKNANTVQGYKYTEPSELEEIRALRKSAAPLPALDRSTLDDKIAGAWYGRICGCYLGKPIEGIRRKELTSFLKETDNYPMHRYILHSDITEDVRSRYNFHFLNTPYADTVRGMPIDDDTNYTVLYQRVIDDHGRDFTPLDISRAWIRYQKKDAYCTAERLAFINFVNGYEPPASAVYKNPYREWIGAQIRADYFGYINPANPEMAAEMAWRDGCISHIKNGIYGEMWAAAMIACAACTTDMKAIIMGGLAEIPHTSRLYEAINEVVARYESGVSEADAFDFIHERWSEENDWCQTIPNALIVASALLYGGGDYEKSVGLAVQAAFDTDCNGATVGSIVGMAHGRSCIAAKWIEPLDDTLHTSIFEIGDATISELVAKTKLHCV